MSVKTNSNKNYWHEASHIFFSPKLSLQGRNVLPKILEPPICFQRQEPFLTVFKKPLNSLYDNVNTVKKDKKQVCVIGKAKQVERRQVYTGIMKRRFQLNDHETNLTKGATIQQMVLSIPKSISQKQGYINPNKPKDDQYYFYIGLGNNATLVEKILKKRGNWTSTSNTLYHLRWEQTRPKYITTSSTQKQVINHLPNHQALSNKGSLLRNLKAYCQKNDQQLYRILPVCFQFDFDTPDICQNQLKKFIQFFWQDQSKNNYLEQQLQKSTVLLKDQQDKTTKLSPKKKIGQNQLSRDNNNSKNRKDTKDPKDTKNNYRKNINSKRDLYNCQGFENSKKKQQIRGLYKSLISKLKTLCNFQDMSNLKKQHPSLIPKVSDVYGQTNLWLLKPADLNRGRGIKLFRSVQQLGDLLQNELSKNQKGSFIIQKYIQKPLLISYQRKFDIRVWTLVTHYGQVYFFKQGYIRTSCQKFSVESTNHYTHLTNNAIQKHSKNYGAYQQGNQISLNFLFDGMLDKQQFMKQMKKYIKISYSAVIDKLFIPPQKTANNTLTNYSVSGSTGTIPIPTKIKHFQIFGYDFMIDIQKHLWLIQVNTNPCLQQSSKLLQMLIPRMLDDAFKLTIDKIFNKKKNNDNNDNQNYFPIDGYNNNQNLWEFISLNNENQTQQ